MTTGWPIREWTTWLEAGGLRAATVRLRRYQLLQAQTEIDCDVDTVTGGQLASLLAEHPWGADARRGMLSALRSFFGWAYDEGLIPADPTKRLRSIRESEPAPRPAPDEVISAAMSAAPVRVRVMLAVGALTGMRRAEIAQIHSSDLIGDHFGFTLRAHGKGGKIRDIPLSDLGLVDLIRDAHGWLFPNGLGSHLSADHVGKLMSRALPPGVTAHKLRHRFATRTYSASSDLLTVQKLLGHATPTTTQRYVKTDADKLRRVAAMGQSGLLGVSALAGGQAF
jgi:integrase/recombinase XerC